MGYWPYYCPFFYINVSIFLVFVFYTCCIFIYFYIPFAFYFLISPLSMSSFCYFIHFINQLSSMISSPIHSSVTLTSCLLFLCLYICCVMLYSVILPSIKILLESKRQVLLYLLHLLTQAIFVDKQFAFSFYIIIFKEFK